MKKILFSMLFALVICVPAFSQESKPLEILENPTPQLSNEQRKTNIEAQGTITIRVEFLANGQIGKVSPINSLPYGLTENAIEAARKIKFQPAVKDGNSTMVSKVIAYNFQYGWLRASLFDEKAEAVIKHAVENLGGEKYLQAKSQIGRGKYSILRDGAIISFQTFVDVMVFPDKERTEFKTGGAKTVQTNTSDTGWIFDGAAQVINVQNKEQIENYRRGIRTSLDNLLRGNWRKEVGVKLQSAGKRQAGLGRRNDVVKLVFADDFAVEFEFSDDGMPAKSIYKRKNSDGETVTEEDRYAQFVDVQGIKTPFIVDHFSNNQQTSRVNYELVEFNKTVSDSIFAKPANAKELKKDLKF
ncbi:MAG: energy transducer TonB [Acidobacteriota bacterium]|nr:energy transducer TonB [Acidobacteriota bacterium]